MTSHQSRQLGSNGVGVFPLGLGCMGMSDLYGPSDEAESIATIRAALDAGVTLLDTGDYRATEARIFPLLSEPGIAVTPYGVLSRGLLRRNFAHAADVETVVCG